MSHLLCYKNTGNFVNIQYIYILNGGEIMNVFSNTQKSIDFFLNMFYKHTTDEDSIRRFVEVEFKPDDRQWAFNKVKNERRTKLK